MYYYYTCYYILYIIRIFLYSLRFFVVRSSIFGWGAMIQVGRSRVRIPMRSLDFCFSLLFPSRRTTAPVSTQPLTEMCTRNLSWGKGLPAHKAGSLTAIFWADCLENVGASTSHNTMGFHGQLQGYIYFTVLVPGLGLNTIWMHLSVRMLLTSQLTSQFTLNKEIFTFPLPFPLDYDFIIQVRNGIQIW
jgi:hypothetical protein